MDQVKVDLKNCYGIKKLQHTFDFKRRAYAIYAPNGVMKSSFAQTFSDATSRAQSIVHELIAEEADACLKAPAGLNLENKIVLAVATRLASERFMIGKIKDDKFVSEIKENQTQVLIGKFKQKFPKETEAIKCLDSVALMTPENIHVNSFMYEPIVDMSDDHLRKLYGKVRALA